jgi:hypothetical protein
MKILDDEKNAKKQSNDLVSNITIHLFRAAAVFAIFGFFLNTLPVLNLPKDKTAVDLILKSSSVQYGGIFKSLATTMFFLGEIFMIVAFAQGNHTIRTWKNLTICALIVFTSSIFPPRLSMSIMAVLAVFFLMLTKKYYITKVID